MTAPDPLIPLLAIPEAARWLLDAGGPVMAVLAAMSVLALTIVLLKLWQFARVGLGTRRRLDEALSLWSAGRDAEALARLARRPNALAQVVHAAMLGRLSHHPEPRLREEIERRAQDLLADLRGQFRSLEVIATLSPLLGLLGTVIGMIGAFQALEGAGRQVDPAILSGGIWVALLTTAAGLAVAIPTVLALNGLERIADGLTRRLEDALTRVFTSDLRWNEATVLERLAQHPETRADTRLDGAEGPRDLTGHPRGTSRTSRHAA